MFSVTAKVSTNFFSSPVHEVDGDRWRVDFMYHSENAVVSAYVIYLGDRKIKKKLKLVAMIDLVGGYEAQISECFQEFSPMARRSTPITAWTRTVNEKIILTYLRPSSSSYNTVTIQTHLQSDVPLPTISSFQSLSNDLQNLLEDSSCKFDCILKTTDGTDIPAHKLILSARSPVFRAMLESDMRETQTGIITVLDCQAEVISDFVRYLYTGKCNDDKLQSHGIEMLRMAHEFSVQSLLTTCEITLAQNASDENIIELLKLAELYQTKYLRDACIAYVVTHSSKLLKENPAFFQTLSHTDMVDIATKLVPPFSEG